MKEKKFDPDRPMSTKEKWIRGLLILILIPPLMYWLVIHVVPDLAR